MSESNVNTYRPVCLIVMDGLSYGADTPCASGDAVKLADTPTLDRLTERWPHSRLEASGRAVGLPEGQMGNSEVGHLNIGAGRVVYQELTRIDLAIENHSFFENSVLIKSIDRAVAQDRTVHLMGLLSDGGVHSSNKHLYALIKLAKERGSQDIAIHCFLDGRDTPPRSSLHYLAQLEAECARLGAGRIATVMGRYYAMDRDNRWDRIQRAWSAMVLGEGVMRDSWEQAISASYDAGHSDEFVEPSIISGDVIKDNDAVIFFNFRPDRAREITRTFTDSGFHEFQRATFPGVDFVCLTEYDPSIKASVAFPKVLLSHVLADVLTENNVRQLHIAETEKYAHVTFFFNGGREEPKNGETRILVPSPQVATYDLQPEMSAGEVGDRLVAAIQNHQADVYVVNFANGDMVGHTGVLTAAIEAVEVVDAQVGRVVEAMLELDGVVFITADHGNAERMLDDDGATPFTAHTCGTVPFIAVNSAGQSAHDGTLADISPTILAAIGIVPPPEWTGTDLVVY